MILLLSALVLVLALVLSPIAFGAAAASGLNERHRKQARSFKADWDFHEAYLKNGYYESYRKQHGDYPASYYYCEKNKHKYL